MALNVELLESSFAAVRPQADAFVRTFYDTLFREYPQTRAFFAHTDLPAQRQKLLASLVLVIDNLRNPEVLSTALKGLGARHGNLGIRAEHYQPVGSALLAAFEHHLGAQWTPEVRQCWVDAFEVIASVMVAGAAEPRQPV